MERHDQTHLLPWEVMNNRQHCVGETNNIHRSKYHRQYKKKRTKDRREMLVQEWMGGRCQYRRGRAGSVGTGEDGRKYYCTRVMSQLSEPQARDRHDPVLVIFCWYLSYKLSRSTVNFLVVDSVKTFFFFWVLLITLKLTHADIFIEHPAHRFQEVRQNNSINQNKSKQPEQQQQQTIRTIIHNQNNKEQLEQPANNPGEKTKQTGHEKNEKCRDYRSLSCVH